MNNLEELRTKRRAVLKQLYAHRTNGNVVTIHKVDLEELGLNQDELNQLVFDLQVLNLVEVEPFKGGHGSRLMPKTGTLTRQGLLAAEGMDDQRYELLRELYNQRHKGGLMKPDIDKREDSERIHFNLLDLKLLGLVQFNNVTVLTDGHLFFENAEITGHGILAYEGVEADPRQSLNSFVTTNFYQAQYMQVGDENTQTNN